MTEDILILVAGFLGDLHVGAVQGAQGHRAVEHQLHVAGAGSLSTCGRDLLRDIRRGDDMLSVRAVVVLHEHHFQLVSHCRIVVDHPGHPVDIADDGLCPGIAGGGLGAEQIDGGMEVGQAALLQTEINIHNRQDVQQLPLVLMQTLDLYVKNEVRVQHHTLMLGNHRAQLLFLQPLDGIEPGNSLIIDLILQLADDIQILQEVAANQLPDHFGQFRVAQANPAAGRDAVGLILEPIGIDTVPVVEAVVLQNLGVDLGNAVDIGAHIHGQVGHMGHVVPDNE